MNDELINNYINKSSWEIKENANASFSLSGLHMQIFESTIKNYMLKNIYSKDIKKAVDDGYMYIHDLGYFSSYCCGHSLQTLLEEGLNGVIGKVSSSPPKHLRSAVNQMVNYLYVMQSEFAGAQAFSNVDTLLAPYIKKDKIDYASVKQAMQEFIYSMNFPTRSGMQAVFSNVTFDLKCPDMYKEKFPKINNEIMSFTYDDCNKEIGMIAKAFFEIMMEGDHSGQPFTFPIPTVNLHKNFVWDDDVAVTIFEATAKYGTANFQNFINSDINPADSYSMCPVPGNTVMLVKTSRGIKRMPIKEVYRNFNRGGTYQVLYDGVWFDANPVQQPKEQLIYTLKLSNGEIVSFGEEHLQPILKNPNKNGYSEILETVSAKTIEVGDYIPYNNKSYTTNLGSYNLGYIIGMYMGDGSNDKKSGLTFSLNVDTDQEAAQKVKQYFEQLGFTTNIKEENKLLSLRINGKESVNFMERYVTRTALDKKFNNRIFDCSVMTRRGILDGWYQSNGGNRGRIYSFSLEAYEQFKTLATSLGRVPKLDYIDEREDRFSNNPCYVFKCLKRKNQEHKWKTVDDILYMKIEDVIQQPTKETVYCFKVDNHEHLFTLANGITTHNCRLRLDMKVLEKNTGGVFGASPNTGSIGVVTINLPRIAYETNTSGYTYDQKKQSFYQELRKYMDKAKESLELKRLIILKQMESGLYPYTRRYINQFKTYFSTIGVIGFNEVCLNLLDKEISTQEGLDFTKEVLKHMANILSEYQEETGNLYNLEQSPAESTCYKLAKKDKEVHSNIIVSGTEEKPYYTNSSHLPVNHKLTLIKTLKHQEELNELYNGGTACHIFLGEKVSDWINCMLLVKKIAEKTTLPFFDITPTFSICPIHGYISGEHQYCPLEHTEKQLKKYGRMN